MVRHFAKLGLNWMTYGAARAAFREAGQLPHFAQGQSFEWSGPPLERKEVSLAISKTLLRYEISLF